MASFEAKVYRLEILPHSNADTLELARVGDYVSCVRKGQFKTGDLGVYIPEQAVLPEWLIKVLGLEGKLAGSAKNRVKAVKLRGVLSQGLILPVIEEGHDPDVHYDGHVNLPSGEMYHVDEGADIADALGLVKYEPPIPTSMSGEVRGAYGKTLKYDIENIKKFPDVLLEGENVVITEKLHGTWCCFGHHPDVEHTIVASKGLSAQGLIFKISDENIAHNLYMRALTATADELGFNVLDRAVKQLGADVPVYLLGEVFGRGVQDLHYGFMHPQFRIFDIFIGDPSSGSYMGDTMKTGLISLINSERVPVLYRGAYSKSIVDELTNGVETVSGTSANMREGVVITPTIERKHDELGRVILKSVSEVYLLRKDATEFT